MANSPLQHNSARYYVYEVVVDGTVRYIGKGSGKRAASHRAIAEGIVRRRAAGQIVKTQKFYNRLAKALKSGSIVQSRIVFEGLTSSQAFEQEVRAIAAAPFGQLWNALPGGQGADSEHFKRNWRDPEIRAKMVDLSPERIARSRLMAEIQWSDPDARERNRKKLIEQWADPTFRADRIAALRRGDTKDRRRKLSEAAKLQHANPDKSEARTAAVKMACNTDAERQRRRNLWKDPDFRQKMSAIRKKSWEEWRAARSSS